MPKPNCGLRIFPAGLFVRLATVSVHHPNIIHELRIRLPSSSPPFKSVIMKRSDDSLGGRRVRTVGPFWSELDVPKRNTFRLLFRGDRPVLRDIDS